MRRKGYPGRQASEPHETRDGLTRIIHEGADFGRDTKASAWYKAVATQAFSQRRLLIAQRNDTTDCPLPRPLQQTPRRNVRSAACELRRRCGVAESRGSAVRVDRGLRPLPRRGSAAGER